MEKKHVIKPGKLGIWEALKEVFGTGDGRIEISQDEINEIEALRRETKNVRKLEEAVAGSTIKDKKEGKFGSNLKFNVPTTEKIEQKHKAPRNKKEESEIER